MPATPSLESGFDAVAGAGWTTVDLDGQGAIDLVWTGDASGEVFGGGTSPHWQVFTGTR